MLLETLDGNSFSLKKGTCMVDSDGIHIQRPRLVKQKQITFSIVINIIVIIFLGYSGFIQFGHVSIGISLFQFIFMGLYFYFIFLLLNATVQTDIKWSSISQIRYKKAVWNLIHPFILIKYLDDKNRLKKRMIVLPSFHKGGNEILDQARNIISHYDDLN